MRVVKIIVLIVLGVIAFFTLIIGVAAPLYEASFNEKRERFLREGTPSTETIVTKTIGRKGKYLIVGPEGSLPPAAGERPEGKWVRVSPATYKQYQIGDRIELLTIGEETFVRDSQFYTVLTWKEATAFFAVAGLLFVVVLRLWHVGPRAYP
jgi:hypothetical protein